MSTPDLEVALQTVSAERASVLKQLRCAKEMKGKTRQPEARERLAAQVKTLTQQAHDLHIQEQSIFGEMTRVRKAAEKKEAHRLLMLAEQERKVIFNDAFRAQCKANLPRGVYARLCRAADAKLDSKPVKAATLLGWLRKKDWI